MSDDDGVALHSMPHPIEVTEPMLLAGREAYGAPHATTAGMLTAVFTAMTYAAPTEPDWDNLISDDALETVEAEITLTDEAVEEMAIRAALGNNGGMWADHYTPEQKEHWRQWVRDFAEHVFAAECRVRVHDEKDDAPGPSTRLP